MTFDGRMWYKYKYIAVAVDVHNEWNFSETVYVRNYIELDSTMVTIATVTRPDSNAQIPFASN